MTVLVYCILSLFNCMIFVLFPGPVRYISYFYGMIEPNCAESAVKPQKTNKRGFNSCWYS